MNKLLLRKASIVAILCGVMMITGCASLHTASLTIEPTAVLTAVPTQAPTAKPALQVDSFASLKAACESKDSITIRLTKDITSTDDLKILSPSNKKREVTLDLNGHTLFFENEKSMYVDSIIAEGDTKPQVTFTLTSGRKGGSVIFMSDPRKWEASGGIVINATFILEGNVMVTAKNMDSTVQNIMGGSLIWINNSPSSLFIMNSGTLNAFDNYSSAIYCFGGGQAIINGGVIKNKGNVVDNYGGKFRMNGGEVQASECGVGKAAISNADFAPPLDVTGDTVLEETTAPESETALPRDTFVMTGGSVSVNGKDSTAVTAESNCTVSGGTISATGENSIGIVYLSEGSKEENLYINLTGGRISGEGQALKDNSSNNAFYKNAKGETVAVDSSVKEIKLG